MKENLFKFLGGVIGIALIFFFIKWGMNIQKTHDETYPWRASIYTETTILDSEDFKDVDSCREWVEEKRADLDSAYETWDYDCGYKCKITDQKIESGKRINEYECEELTK